MAKISPRASSAIAIAATAFMTCEMLCAQPAPSGHGPVALRAGVAKVDITPLESMQMYGYANRKCGPSNGTHDPLFAKVVVLDAAGGGAGGSGGGPASRIAIVTLDLGSMLSANLREQVAAKLGIPVLLLAASHTHSAPSFLPFGSSPGAGTPAAGYLSELESKIFGAVQAASQSMFPARLGIASGSMQLGYNRLLPRDDGRARALFDNLERVPYGPVDPEFQLLRIDDSRDGKPRALIVHYAVHAVVLGPTSCKYSADYPGVMQAKVEQELPGVQAMFVQGGAGDINPLFQGRSGKEDADFSVMQKMGELLAGAVVRANREVKPLPGGSSLDGKEASIESKSEVLTFADRWEKDKSLDIGITTVLINKEIAIATVPGEAMHRFQRVWKEQADVPFALFYGYTYSSGGTWAGYIPDLRSAAYGGYGADASTRIEVGAGERIMLHHLTNLYGLRGMWRSEPGRP
jgi:neutral ceramidase